MQTRDRNEPFLIEQTGSAGEDSKGNSSNYWAQRGMRWGEEAVARKSFRSARKKYSKPTEAPTID